MKNNEKIDVVLQPSLGHRLDAWHQYQSHYVMGLRMLPEVRFRYGSRVDHVLAAMKERRWRGASAVWRALVGLSPDGRSERPTFVGRYTVRFPDRAAPLRVAVDVHDARTLRDPDAYSWANVYFKSSYWPTLDYGPKVRPLVGGHGALDHRRIARLIGLRDHGRELDLVFVAKLWAGRPGAARWNPVEHLVRMFETLAKLDVRSYLRAIVPPEEPTPRLFLDRLSAAGVSVVNDIAIEELWRATSASRLAFLRQGKHLGISWRMIDHLAMGACTVCDHAPYPEWPVPLQPGRELVDCGCGVGPDDSLPDRADYARVADTVMSLLADPERIAATRRAAARYFDEHAAPARIARYFMDVSQSFVADEVGSRPRPAARIPLANRARSAVT